MGRHWSIGAAGICILLFSGFPAGQNQVNPRWWEIKITISTKGEYKQDAKDVQVGGSYSFTITWTGTMERDEEDYRLFHAQAECLNWEAEERANYPEEIRVLTTKDFPDKPELRVNYILKKDEDLFFDFFVRGFDVPLSPATQRFALSLPASEENSFAPPGGSYNGHVQTGSNKIIIEEKQIYRAPVEKRFAWTWKNQAWIQEIDKNIFQANNHQVQVKILITPRS